MGEHDGQLISASQEKCHVIQFFVVVVGTWWGGSNLSSGVHTELRRVTTPLS